MQPGNTTPPQRLGCATVPASSIGMHMQVPTARQSSVELDCRIISRCISGVDWRRPGLESAAPFAGPDEWNSMGCQGSEISSCERGTLRKIDETVADISGDILQSSVDHEPGRFIRPSRSPPSVAIGYRTTSCCFLADLHST